MSIFVWEFPHVLKGAAECSGQCVPLSCIDVSYRGGMLAVALTMDWTLVIS